MSHSSSRVEKYNFTSLDCKPILYILQTATEQIEQQITQNLSGFFETATIDDIEKFLTIYITAIDTTHYSKKINLLTIFNNFCANLPGGVYRDITT